MACSRKNDGTAHGKEELLARALGWFEAAVAGLESFPVGASDDKATAVTGQLIKTKYYFKCIPSTVKLKRRKELALWYPKPGTSNGSL